MQDDELKFGEEYYTCEHSGITFKRFKTEYIKGFREGMEHCICIIKNLIPEDPFKSKE